MPLPPISVAVQIPREGYYALRDYVDRLSAGCPRSERVSMAQIIQGWIAPKLAELPPGRGPCPELAWLDERND